MRKIMSNFGIFILSLGILLTSCTKDDGEWTDVDNFVFQSYTDLRDNGMGGHHQCYEVIFPITVLFPDETSQEVADREELLATLKAWKQDNPGAGERPTLDFPIEVINADGDTVTVESKEQAKEMRKNCKSWKKAHRACGKFARFIDNDCFSVELPISLILPNGETVQIEEKSDVRKLLKRWKKNRPNDVPEIVFPVNITMKEDSTQVAVNSFEQFEEIIEDCKE